MSDMSTYTAKRFDPLQMTVENVAIEDIAHALSLTCRGGGQIRYFFSVAQHSVNCAREAAARGGTAREKLACLLHDASEAYVSDIIRPVKPYLSNYYEIETRIMAVIREAFGLGTLTEAEERFWKTIDDAMLSHELKTMLPGCEDFVLSPLAAVPDLSERPMREVEQEFLALYELLKLTEA